MEGVESHNESGMRNVAVQMVSAMAETPAGAAEKWASIIGQLCALTSRPEGGVVGTTRHVAPVDLPIWAQGAYDKRAALPWDTSQTIANCKVNGISALAIIDSGSYKTIMDIGMAKMLSLPIRESVGGDCGTYSVPGTGRSNTYAGIVDAEVRL
jgi:hypothetical protein